MKKKEKTEEKKETEMINVGNFMPPSPSKKIIKGIEIVSDNGLRESKGMILTQVLRLQGSSLLVHCF